jgi:hypothetical protein
MHTDYEYSNPAEHARGAHEINLHARQMEKKTALLNLINHDASTGSTGNVQKMVRRIGALLGSLFLG